MATLEQVVDDACGGLVQVIQKNEKMWALIVKMERTSVKDTPSSFLQCNSTSP